MPNVTELLRESDPLPHEPLREEDRIRMRRAVMAGASRSEPSTDHWFRAPRAVAALVALIVAGVFAVSLRGPRGSATVYAAVRFEVRLAEAQPGAGLHEARVSGSDRVIYLHDEAILTNVDVERCTAVAGSEASRYNIGVELNGAGAEKARQATLAHEGRPLAVLIDGEVVMAPILRSPIARSAVITGDFSKAEAERIVNGIGAR